MASVPGSFLEMGLAALKQGNYPAAIAHLEAVCQTQLSQQSQVKAQMGLVVAYERQGKIPKAIALCQTLSQSTNPQVREWATCTITNLRNRCTTADKPVNNASEQDDTGFVAFAPPPQPSRPVVPPPDTSAPSAPPVPPYPQRGPRVPPPPPPLEWRRAGRAKRWQPLAAVNLVPLVLLQAVSAIALFWLLSELLKFAMLFTNDLLVKLPYLEPFQPFYRAPTQFVLLTLVIFITLSPWLLDGLLRLFYGLQPLSINTLSTHSPEAIRVLKRYCRQRSWPLPQLGILPTSAPMALTYGNLPRTARIVVSQGLLEQLADDEIASIYAGQLGHIAGWDFVVMSLFILVTQLPYTIYRLVSQWGDRIEVKRQQAKSNRHFYFYVFTFCFFLAGAIASFAYGVWYLLGGPALWLNQVRIYYSDRLATEITGNPNGLTRALLKISQGIVNDIQQQEHTSWLLESLNLLTSVGYLQAITLGRLHSCTQVERVLAWDCLNPYRRWLIINNTHPLMGDRLQCLARIAHHWHLETELNLNMSQESLIIGHTLAYPPGNGNFALGVQEGVSESVTVATPGASAGRFSPAPTSFAKDERQAQSFLLQVAPFFGIPVSFALGGLTWLIGGVSILLGIAQLAWMYGDWLLIKGYLPIGFSIGTFMRINSFFPDIKPSTVQPDPSLLYLLANPTALPVDSQPVRLQGKLLGRRGISNWLGQDLTMQSLTGLVKFHHVSGLGPVGNFFLCQSPSPRELVGQHLIVTGWFRRGATAWIDIDTLRTKTGKTISSGHPFWSTLLASAAAGWGAYIILSG